MWCNLQRSHCSAYQNGGDDLIFSHYYTPDVVYVDTAAFWSVCFRQENVFFGVKLEQIVNIGFRATFMIRIKYNIRHLRDRFSTVQYKHKQVQENSILLYQPHLTREDRAISQYREPLSTLQVSWSDSTALQTQTGSVPAVS